jgi:dolichol-phosphate mannosyltransferase
VPKIDLSPSRGRAQARPAVSSPASTPIELSIVIPTFNEAENLAILVDRVARSLVGVGWEILFVDDDSPDGTSSIARQIARSDRRVRIVTRVGRRGLASACIEGILASAGPYVAVMDADLQHDETLLHPMLEVVRAGEADCVVGSRYLHSHGVEGWDAQRVGASRFATRVAQRLTGTRLTDPMSGFFVLRQDAVLPLVPKLSGVGFKILLDIVLTAPAAFRVRELPYSFRPRERGDSKFDARAAYDFLYLILDKLTGRWVPTRFLLFTAVGSLGVFVHLAVVWLLFVLSGVGFVVAQTAATLVAMTTNFLLNNELTFRDRRLRGFSLLRGWATFALACSVGALANVGIAAQLFAQDRSWWISALGGIVVGAVWNYAVTSFYTWGRR